MKNMYVNERLYTEVGDFWVSSTGGTVFEVANIYPSLGGTTRVKYGFKCLNYDREYVWNANEVMALLLKPIDPEDVPMALLGAA